MHCTPACFCLLTLSVTQHGFLSGPARTVYCNPARSAVRQFPGDMRNIEANGHPLALGFIAGCFTTTPSFTKKLGAAPLTSHNICAKGLKKGADRQEQGGLSGFDHHVAGLFQGRALKSLP
ncbi:hypothetical protein L207DRAFT_26465 [Hyaloscypha variabilis F]|uniref:Secreted protein n=1 Tax=Hyaloscypha variabilis (strain UAMH 11265 / GT02V1 / F) TaxID=1149755 RepID=A0A2J6RMJ9_HYAVF|nr:hypothetical protein L207DRAFT_26465 [Hyaloscypha variabilis F]